MRTIGAVTVGRSDYSIYLPVLRAIRRAQDLRLHLVVSGSHLAPEFGRTVTAIEDDGFEIGDAVEMLLSADTPAAVAKSAGVGMIGFADAYARHRPDILLVLGDRYEMHAAAAAAVPFKIPLAHIHGGESTEGAIDELLRHSLTKMSHLHFVSTARYAERLVRMGEEPWRVTVAGAPSLDNLRHLDLLGRDEIEKQYGLDLDAPFLLVTYHPVTLEYEETAAQVEALLAALESVPVRVVFTYPNADTSSRVIIDAVHAFAHRHPGAQVVANLGTQRYFSLMSHAAAMVGNSSSGIIEAASLKLPVVNVGTRQQGRLRNRNVIDVGYGVDDVASAIRRATSREFRAELVDLVNEYGDGHAAERIVERLKSVPLDGALLRKRFHES